MNLASSKKVELVLTWSVVRL